MGQRNLLWDYQYAPTQNDVVCVAPELDHYAEWRAFGFRRNVALTLLFGWPPMTATLFLVSRMALHRPVVSLTFIIAWLLAAMYAVWWAGEFRCPRCRRRYGALGSKKGTVNFTRGIFDEICANCKLRKFERMN